MKVPIQKCKKASRRHFILQHFSSAFLNFGERPPLQKCFDEINSDLQFAYQYVSQFVTNLSVLDFGCGGGYGTEFLSRFTSKKTLGFDVNQCAVDSANSFFTRSTNLQFSHLVPHERFDIITSFQVIEHVAPADLPEYFKTISTHLQPNGQVFIATPNKNITSFRLKTPIMPFHIVEYTPDTFEKLLQKYFSYVKVYGQISQPTAEKVAAGKFSYSDLSQVSFKYKVIRFISQIKPVRYLARYIHQDVKNFILGFGQAKLITTPQLLTTDKLFVENSYILIAQCQP